MDIEKFIDENTNLGGSVVAITYSKERLIELLYKYNQTLQFQQINVIDDYSEKDIDNAYNKGFKDAMIKYRTDF